MTGSSFIGVGSLALNCAFGLGPAHVEMFLSNRGLFAVGSGAFSKFSPRGKGSMNRCAG